MQPDPSIMQAMMTGFRGEPRDMEQTGPDGSRLVMRRGRNPGIERTLEQFGEDGSSLLHMTFYHPSQERPESYPQEMPFVSNHFVMVGGSGGDHMVVWPEGSSDLFDIVAAECRSAGWALDHEDHGPEAPLLRTIAMRRGEAARKLFFVPVPKVNMVILTEDDFSPLGS